MRILPGESKTGVKRACRMKAGQICETAGDEMNTRRNALPAAFRAAAVALLLAACAVLVWSAARQSAFSRVLPDLEVQLNTSRGRERKQQAEYDEVSAALPLVEQELAEVQPQADAAAAQEADLRAQRKERRAQAQEAQQALAGAQEALTQAEDAARLLLSGEEATGDAP